MVCPEAPYLQSECAFVEKSEMQMHGQGNRSIGGSGSDKRLCIIFRGAGLAMKKEKHVYAGRVDERCCEKNRKRCFSQRTLTPMPRATRSGKELPAEGCFEDLAYVNMNWTKAPPRA